MEHERLFNGAPAFGSLLRRYRLGAGLSQEALAKRAGMSAHGVSALERGARRSPQRATLELLASALELTPEQRRTLEAAAVRVRIVRPGGILETPASRPRTQTAEASNLPSQLTSFVSRETEIAELAELLKRHRLITITGSGGIGKTRTALEVAAAVSNTVDGRVRLVELASLVDASFVAGEIARVLDVQQAPHRPIVETLVTLLANERLLIVFDNCEHIIGEAARIVQILLRGCRELRILTTSRELLRVRGEVAYRLPPLPVPRIESAARLRVKDAGTFGAVALFSERARAAHHQFALTDENAETVAAICRRLDGIPLAIELAAARARVLSVHALLQGLDRPFALLTGGGRTALPHQQTMRATVEWSYGLLSQAEQRLFNRLSVFAGGWTLKTATAVCSEDAEAEENILETLGSLVDKSLVIADAGRPESRFALLESFREYGRELLEKRGESGMILHRHAIAFTDLAEPLEREYWTQPNGTFALARAEMDNWRTALSWTLGRKHHVLLGQRLAASLSVVWGFFDPVEGRKWVRQALELADSETPPEVIARLKLSDASITCNLYEHDDAVETAAEASALFQALGDRVGEARAKCLIGFVHVDRERPEDAEPFLREALELVESGGPAWLTAWILSPMVVCQAQLGDIRAARRSYDRAVAILRSAGTTSAIPSLSHRMAEAEFRAGNVGVALRLASQALSEFRALNIERTTAATLCNIAAYEAALGEHHSARRHARKALEISRRYRVESGPLVWALQHIAATALFLSEAPSRLTIERATLLFGFADNHFAVGGVSREYTEQQEYDRAHALLTSVLPSKDLSDLKARGASMTEDEAVTLGLLLSSEETGAD